LVKTNIASVWNYSGQNNCIVFFNGTVKAEMYRNSLIEELPLLLEDLSLEVRNNTWYQNYGCLAHSAREVLNTKYNWPARSPDLTAPDFFLWGYLNEKVCFNVPAIPEDMKKQIHNACVNIERDVILHTH